MIVWAVVGLSVGCSVAFCFTLSAFLFSAINFRHKKALRDLERSALHSKLSNVHDTSKPARRETCTPFASPRVDINAPPRTISDAIRNLSTLPNISSDTSGISKRSRSRTLGRHQSTVAKRHRPGSRYPGLDIRLMDRAVLSAILESPRVASDASVQELATSGAEPKAEHTSQPDSEQSVVPFVTVARSMKNEKNRTYGLDTSSGRHALHGRTTAPSENSHARRVQSVPSVFMDNKPEARRMQTATKRPRSLSFCGQAPSRAPSEEPPPLPVTTYQQHSARPPSQASFDSGDTASSSVLRSEESPHHEMHSVDPTMLENAEACGNFARLFLTRAERSVKGATNGSRVTSLQRDGIPSPLLVKSRQASLMRTESSFRIIEDSQTRRPDKRHVSHRLSQIGHRRDSTKAPGRLHSISGVSASGSPNERRRSDASTSRLGNIAITADTDDNLETISSSQVVADHSAGPVASRPDSSSILEVDKHETRGFKQAAPTLPRCTTPIVAAILPKSGVQWREQHHNSDLSPSRVSLTPDSPTLALVDLSSPDIDSRARPMRHVRKRHAPVTDQHAIQPSGKRKAAKFSTSTYESYSSQKMKPASRLPNLGGMPERSPDDNPYLQKKSHDSDGGPDWLHNQTVAGSSVLSATYKDHLQEHKAGDFGQSACTCDATIGGREYSACHNRCTSLLHPTPFRPARSPNAATLASPEWLANGRGVLTWACELRRMNSEALGEASLQGRHYLGLATAVPGHDGSAV